MRLYLSGPITGLPDYNKPAFAEATAKLEAHGHIVLNPHTVCVDLSAHSCQLPCTPSELELPWADYLRADLVAMLTKCDALAMLPGWENSRGASLEAYIAKQLGWEVDHWENWLDPYDFGTEST